MSRDYKNDPAKKRKRQPARRKRRRSSVTKPLPAWSWFLLGVLTSTSIGLAYVLIQGGQFQFPGKPRESAASGPSSVANSKLVVTPETPQFEFYSVLPEMEVEVPPEELRPSPSARWSRNDVEIYQLQLGSFRHRKDAERMEASLGLIGIDAHIEKVSINDKAHYRVRSGPYTRDQVYGLHNRLQKNSVRSQILRVRKQ